MDDLDGSNGRLLDDDSGDDDVVPPLVALSYDGAVAWLDDHIGAGIKPGLERMHALLESMGEPHRAYATVHIAGTNGKTSTSRLVAAILGAHGLKVGTYTSPHLERVNERVDLWGDPISDDDFARAASDIQPFVDLYEQRTDDRVTYFELTTLIAMAAFADAAADVAVFEVGLGGRLDATNVLDATVSVVTGISLEHTELLGDTVLEIAGEKVAILQPGGRLVTGPLPAAAEGAITARVADTASQWTRFGDDFATDNAVPAVGGWQCDVRGVYDTYPQLFIGFHGRHQTINLATAIATCEEFFGRALDVDAVRAGVAGVRNPGRLEIVHRRPLVVIDGAHNVEGMEVLASSLREEFPERGWTVVFGARGDRNVGALLEPLRDLIAAIVVTAPDDPQAISTGDVVADVVGASFDAVGVDGVAAAVDHAIDLAGEDGQVVIAGSLYVAGEARSHLSERESPTPPG